MATDARIRGRVHPARLLGVIAATVLLAAGCAKKESVKDDVPTPVEVVLPPTTTRGEFTLEADKNDTWNAVGQLLVNTPGVEYQGRSQIMDVYTLRYRGQEFLVQTKAMLLSDTIKRTTTRVTATTLDGKPIDTDASATVLAMLQEKLPAAIVDVQRRFAEEAKAKQKAKSKGKSKAKAKKKKKSA